MPKVRTLQNSQVSQKPITLEKTEEDTEDEEQSRTQEQLPTNETQIPIKKPKRTLTEEHKKILSERLAKAREIKKQQANQKQEFENKIKQEKEREAEQKLIQKVKKISKQKEREIILKYLSESDEEEDTPIIVKKPQPKPKPKQQPVSSQPVSQPVIPERNFYY